MPRASCMTSHDLTICCIDCVNDALAVRALQRSQKAFPGARTVLFTDHHPEAMPEGIEVVLIPPIRSKRDYSLFLVKEMVEHVTTAHVLVVQWDGFVLNPDCWTPDFLAYDYIGAPWPADLSTQDVGNGGFSLRSRKLMQALLDERITPESIVHEDHSICVQYRQLLEKEHGIRFAPRALAERFAYETTQPVQKTFGFHGVQNLGDVWNEDELVFFLRTVSRPVLRAPEIIWTARHLQGEGRLREAIRVAGAILAESPDNPEVLDLILQMQGHLRVENYQAHAGQRFFVGNLKRHLPQFFRQCRVLELGSRDADGSMREWFDHCQYVGVDVLPGKGVDQVVLPAHYAASSETFDTIVCCEWLEHDPLWAETLENARRLLKPGGLLIVAAASAGRARHARCGQDAQPMDYYRNLGAEDIRALPGWLTHFEAHYLVEDTQSHDLLFFGLAQGATAEVVASTRKMAGDMRFLHRRKYQLGEA